LTSGRRAALKATMPWHAYAGDRTRTPSCGGPGEHIRRRQHGRYASPAAHVGR
jgi:hypothetical protein